jgi:pimeloyl-ACP methyl ester carboxylesterase
VPTLVACGARDRANLGPSREMAAGMPNAELRIVPDAVHLWNLQQPELFNETVAEFVARSSDQTRGAEGAAVGHVGPRDRIP